jgi:hypothetical protein
MSRYVFRWELPSGDDPLIGCIVNNNKVGNYQYVFTTMKSALMWMRNLAWGYDNPSRSDLVLCIYEADECYPVCVDIGTREKPHRCSNNAIDSFCYEYIARIWNRLPISYVKYEDIKAYGKMLNKCKSRKAIVEFLQLPKDELYVDDVSFYDDKITTKWVYWQNIDQTYELVTD